MELTIGPGGGESVDATNTAIQEALDRVSAAGGGRVHLRAGVYTLQNAVRVPSGIQLSGEGEKTILRRAPGWEQPLGEDGDWGDEWVGCENLPPVAVGDGVLICSDAQFNWQSTVGTVLEIAGARFRISQTFTGNYLVSEQARVTSGHPMIALENAEGICISDLVMDGNAEKNPRMDGCRGGGIWALRSHKVSLQRVLVRHVNGDGISFQNSHDWQIENCVVEDNRGSGIHPGSGAQRPLVRNCVVRRNGGWGIFVCWRVQHGRFEGNRIEGNTAGGISIGHKDSDNLFRENQLLRNRGPAIHCRGESFPMAPHCCAFERNLLQGNNGGGPQVVIEGAVRDWIFHENRYEPSAGNFQVGPEVMNLVRETSS